MNSKHTIPIRAKSALILACIFWAASFIASKIALKTIPPLTVVMLRLVISSICFIIWILFVRERFRFQGLKWLSRLLLLSLFGTGLHYGLQTIGIKYTTAANASIYAVMGPISILIIAAVFLKEKVTLRKMMGVGCALVGVLIVMGIDTLLAFELKGHLKGDILVFASIFMWGIFTVLGKNMIQEMSALSMTALITFLGSLYMIPMAWMEIKTSGFSLTSIEAEAWGAIAFLGISCSFLATLFYVFALEKAESQKVGVYLYTIPPMSYLFAALFLGESIGASLLIGSVLILGGVYLTERG